MVKRSDMSGVGALEVSGVETKIGRVVSNVEAGKNEQAKLSGVDEGREEGRYGNTFIG